MDDLDRLLDALAHAEVSRFDYLRGLADAVRVIRDDVAAREAFARRPDEDAGDRLKAAVGATALAAAARRILALAARAAGAEVVP